MDITKTVYNSLVRRGYGMDAYGLSVPEYNKEQLVKCIEEIGEVARHIFDGESPPAQELADATIPLLAMFYVCGYDFEKEVLAKVRNDINRGRRDANGSNATKPIHND